MDTIGVTAAIGGDDIKLYILEVLNGILEAAAERRQNKPVVSLGGWRADATKIPEYCDGRVDGMILLAPEILAPETLSHHTPFVTIHGNEVAPNTDNLDVDNRRGAYEITRFIIECGHRNIIHFPGSQELLGVRQRIEGFRQAMEEADLSCDESRIVEGNFSGRSGHRRAEALMTGSKNLPMPTAIFCGSDAIAYGCMEVLASRELRVPDDISIAGFDDTLMARVARPALTTVCQPFRQMGRCAVEKLLQLIDGNDGHHASNLSAADCETPDANEGRVRVFPAQLIIRESVGPPPMRPVFPP